MAAWDEFIRRFHPVITAAAVRVSHRWGHGGSDEVEDLVQEIYLRLCGNQASLLTGFRDQRPDAIFGYLKAAATNIAHDFYRWRSAAKRGSDKTTSLEELPDISAVLPDLDRKLTLTEIDGMLQRHTQVDQGVRDRAVFRLYYWHGLTAQGIADLPGIGLTPKGVESVLRRLTTAIRRSFNEPQGISGRFTT